jgi:hypothetical protein
MFWTLLRVQGFSYFEHHLRRMLEAEDSESPNNDLIEEEVREFYDALEYFLKRAIHVKDL